MKFRYTFILILFMMMAMPSLAQNKFRFIYVAPDDNMDQQSLIRDLEDHHNHIVMEGNPAIFYLSFGENPIIVKFNTGNNDNPDDFESELLNTLRHTMSYGVRSEYDRRKVMEILDENSYENDEGDKQYNDIELDFHVGKAFWDSGNNESIIAPVYFTLDAAKHIANKEMQFNVMYRCPQSKGTLNRDAPFGVMNPDNMNTDVTPRTTD